MAPLPRGERGELTMRGAVRAERHPDALMLPPFWRPSRTLRAAEGGGREGRPSLTAAAPGGEALRRSGRVKRPNRASVR
jgi:hypothetical protein